MTPVHQTHHDHTGARDRVSPARQQPNDDIYAGDGNYDPQNALYKKCVAIFGSSMPIALHRIVSVGLVVGVIALAIGTFLTLENAHYSRGGRVPFSFSYRGLDRVAAAPGEWVRLERHAADGRLEDVFVARQRAHGCLSVMSVQHFI